MKRFLPLAALTLALGAQVAAAKTCELTIEGNDVMQFSTKELTVEKDCTEVKLTLKHTGKAPKAVMGHNWVLVAEGDLQAVTKDAVRAGVAKEYVPEGDARVLAATKLVGGGEETSVTFKKSLLKAGTTYKYVCTFPGHAALMTGTLKF